MILAHNMSAMNAMRQCGIVTNQKTKSTEKLSSGYRINKAADDAAGLAISETMRRQIKGLTQGSRNCQDGVSVCQVADGALSEVNEMLNRITQLSVQAANATLSDDDREDIQQEIKQLTAEISRVGQTTTFNEIPIFQLPGKLVETNEPYEMSLISSPSASVGYLSEAYQVGNLYFPSASMDFSSLNRNNIPLLDNKSFSFTCSQSCPETFSFTFVDADGTQSKFLNPSSKGQNTAHNYQIDIHGLVTGSQVLDAVLNTVKNNPPRDNAISADGLAVSHSNVMLKEGANKLVIRATGGSGTNPDTVVKSFLASKKNTAYGKADFAEVAGLRPMRLKSTLEIQYGTEAGQRLELEIDNMDSEVLGVSDLDVTTVAGCYDALNRTKDAMQTVNSQRAKLGAQQNRLEHTIRNEDNIIENTTAAESAIRDTDITTEMVSFSNINILEQCGMSMMAQANQLNQHVLSLLE